MGLPYRSDEEVRQWMSRDPITRYKKWLLAKGLASESRAREDRGGHAGGASRRRSSSRARARIPDPRAGVLNTYAKGAAMPTQFYNRTGLVTRPRRRRETPWPEEIVQLRAARRPSRRRCARTRTWSSSTSTSVPTADAADRRGARPREGVRPHADVGPRLADRRSTGSSAPRSASPPPARRPSRACRRWRAIYAIEYVQNQAGKIRSMTGGQASMPFVLWQDGAGRRRGSAGQHTDVGQEALYAAAARRQGRRAEQRLRRQGPADRGDSRSGSGRLLRLRRSQGRRPARRAGRGVRSAARQGGRAAAGRGRHDRRLGAGDGGRDAGAARHREGRASASSSSIRER